MTPKLNRKLNLETLYRTRDDAGGYTESWHSLGVLWASVLPGSGREAELEGLTISSVPYKITVRAAPIGAASRPKPGQRLRDGSRNFRLVAVTEAKTDARYLICFAREEEVAT